MMSYYFNYSVIVYKNLIKSLLLVRVDFKVFRSGAKNAKTFEQCSAL